VHRLVDIELSVADGHLTPTLELRRHRVVAALDREIAAMYSGDRMSR
jgi:long-subunit acyl-CoA synthetase (AMP-forming)